MKEDEEVPGPVLDVDDVELTVRSGIGSVTEIGESDHDGEG